MNPSSLVTARGQKILLTLDRTSLTIQKTLVGCTVSWRIPLSTISAVEFRPAGLVGRGSFSVSVIGSDAAPQVGAGLSRATQAVEHPNAWAFSRKQQKDFEAIRDAIPAYRDSRN